MDNRSDWGQIETSRFSETQLSKPHPQRLPVVSSTTLTRPFSLNLDRNSSRSRQASAFSSTQSAWSSTSKVFLLPDFCSRSTSPQSTLSRGVQQGSSKWEPPMSRTLNTSFRKFVEVIDEMSPRSPSSGSVVVYNSWRRFGQRERPGVFSAGRKKKPEL